ncbi:MAG: PTS sugar transporter subunit IIC [Gemmatimonadetes bacterium]|nr:PTS sugar transporter subunit IIC [Gemmatimonadota bacterium]
MPEPYQWVLLCLLGGWTAVDGASWGQFMISRPIIAALAAGAVLGSPAPAAQLGLVLEALHLRVLPIGAARYPEGGPAAVVGGATAAMIGGSSGVLTAAVFVLVWEWLGGETVRQLRNWNTPAPPSGEFTPAALERGHVMAIGADFARGVLLVLVGVPLLFALALSTEPLLAGYGNTSARLLATALAAGLGSAVGLFGTAHARYALAGAGVGLAFVALR